ncbi:uncharacterized protein E6C27_scaffold128G00720 [Cucumis melo var. makuwa]|uniref:Uncharacterized protein n=1 Tax=Cucumis melo var. makuwa TaxID=1194695 RepID=A0A5A7TCG0_CUCMM|nr:uncharacterized protein E6C27_scaffold128G00720 [Cucumis melo var. makuwa]
MSTSFSRCDLSRPPPAHAATYLCLSIANAGNYCNTPPITQLSADRSCLPTPTVIGTLWFRDAKDCLLCPPLHCVHVSWKGYNLNAMQDDTNLEIDDEDHTEENVENKTNEEVRWL